MKARLLLDSHVPAEVAAALRKQRPGKDRASLPGWIALRIADGKDHAGIIFYDPERFKAPWIAALARALAAALDQTRGRLANRWITLR